MKAYRTHHFPSLARLQADPHALVEAEAADSALTEEVLEEYRKAGYDEGHTAGYAEGSKMGSERASREARAAFDAISEPLETVVAGFGQMQKDFQAASREQLVTLVEQVARQVVRAELETAPKQILALIDEALAELPKPAETVEVRLHPNDYQRVLKAAPRRAKSYGLVPDPQLEAGECRISAGDRELDVGCAQRLAACIEQIHAVMFAETGVE
ncbi:flagellar assembly protein FliH [Dyella sp. M7H15-1]|uniref:FliH/SctL family protein n=1 Tax=Dyella sp. M7H15-1 TaxID=2501295 RepID=UPI001004EFB9|nr:FliH/SctL family protein [Dyella sp. M7H15-1]QAU24299.1 flagellar assembly protein FliH [Dyella sp. M7H15-1]